MTETEPRYEYNLGVSENILYARLITYRTLLPEILKSGS
jgi:hypothetical protein